ncbi:MAG: anion permease [Bacteroidota bacterium]
MTDYMYLLIPFVIAMFLAINMGGSGTAPAFSAAFGANVINRNLIPGLFGIMVFTGAIFAGKETTATLGKGIINPDLLSFQMVSLILFSVSISLLIANLFGIPQSTSQSTVMAIVAPAIYFNEYNTGKLFFEIIPTWFILPVISFFLCLLIGKYIYKPLRKRGYTLSKKVNESSTLKFVIILMSMYVAFSIGSNNVANAAGPISSMMIKEMHWSMDKNFMIISFLSMLIIAPNFGIGSSVFGYKIMKNTGKEIVIFGKIEAAIIAFVSASLLLFASLYNGIPTSLVQVNVAAILGIGVAKLGYKNIFRKTETNRFFVMWVISPAIAFLLALTLTFAFDRFGWL